MCDVLKDKLYSILFSILKLNANLEFARLFNRHTETMDDENWIERHVKMPETKQDRKKNIKTYWWSIKTEHIVIFAIVLIIACSIISIMVIAVYLTGMLIK